MDGNAGTVEGGGIMKQTNEDDLTKALRCLGSQNGEGCCYEDYENMRRLESGEKLLMCAENPEGKERCPYHQSAYGCCFEDAECMEWLGKAADEIISQRKELEELRAYKTRMEMQYLDDIGNLLEPLKLQSALESEIFKYNYRKEHKPQDINILDYTVMAALKDCLERQVEK